MSKTKSFEIPTKVVGEAYKRVKANHGAAGVDKVSIEAFETNLEDNLYKIWNRMSSGSYFPPPVRQVEIPKDEKSTRKLGIPTVADRIAQMVTKEYLEPLLEPIFHPDSYGYRPGKSAIDAVGVARKRCWKYDWVLDLDIKGYFDNIDHDIMMGLLRQHTDCKWILLYVERWLKAQVQLEDGSLKERTKGTPQGGVISPLLANLYLHHAFDDWMREKQPTIPFERYADDIVVHCRSEKQIRWLRARIEKRLAEFKLELHPEKTKEVYCKKENRKGGHPMTKFDFLGFEFRPRSVVAKKSGKHFLGYTPAISPKSLKKIYQETRSLKLHLKSGHTLEDLAELINPMMRGWMNYYGSYCKSALDVVFRRLNWILNKWATKKYKRLRKSKRLAWKWLKRIMKKEPTLFAHWSN